MGGTSITVTPRVNWIRAQFGSDGAAAGVHIDFSLVDSNGRNLGGGTHSLYPTGPQATDQFTTDGTTAAFTSKQAPYGGADPTVTLNGQVVASGVTFTTNTDGTVTATFATVPTAATGTQPNLQLAYPTGPSLGNSAGDLVSALGLTSGQGTVYSGQSGKLQTAHAKIGDLGALLLEWARVRVTADKL